LNDNQTREGKILTMFTKAKPCARAQGMRNLGGRHMFADVV